MEHILKTIRDKVGAALSNAAIAVDISGAPVAVRNLVHPPRGGSIDETELPAVFVSVEGESIDLQTMNSVTRTTVLVVYMFAKSVGNPLDQLDEMQLKIELALYSSKPLEGVCYEFRPVRMSVQQDRGRVDFASRALEYRCVASVTSSNPTI